MVSKKKIQKAKNHSNKKYFIELIPFCEIYITQKYTPDIHILLLNCTPHTVCEIFEAIFKVKFQNNRLAENPVYSARIYIYKI